MSSRVLLLMPTTSYKSEDFLAAAERLGIEVVVGTDRRQALEDAVPGTTMTFDFERRSEGVRQIVAVHERAPFAAVVGVDDETTVLAAAASAALHLPHNPEASVRATRDKYVMRTLMAKAGMRAPRFRRAGLDVSASRLAEEVDYPCVLKPLSLAASRGVIRADGPDEFVAAFDRIATILRRSDVERKGGDRDHLIVEDYLPGVEVALEGLLAGGRLRVLALFDKPDPLEGPTFEETIFVTPSRLPASITDAITREVAEGCRALGLREGAVHAELRVADGLPWLLEVAARTIGGLCSRALRFGTGITLEELVMMHALGQGVEFYSREREAAGVMMIPIPRSGVLRGVHGLDEARATALVAEVTMTVHSGAELVPLPEGDRYVGFIVAKGQAPDDVERALREAHSRIRLDIASD